MNTLTQRETEEIQHTTIFDVHTVKLSRFIIYETTQARSGPDVLMTDVSTTTMPRTICVNGTDRGGGDEIAFSLMAIDIHRVRQSSRRCSGIAAFFTLWRTIAKSA